MMKNITSILFLVITFFVNAQSSLYIKSIVVDDDTGNPVESAKVQIEDKGLITYTNFRGLFLFNKILPEGNYLVSISKEKYKTKSFLVRKRRNLEFNLKEIRISVNRKEAKRRRKIRKQKEKEAKKRRRRLKKEKQQEEPLLEKNTRVVEYDTRKRGNSELRVSEIQTKYANILGIEASKLTNKRLYEFIDRWMGTPYLWGGETKDAIDCSSFSQRLFIKSYNIYLERTAQKQSNSKYTELFTNLKHLKEGDLLFFGKDQFSIVHVGVYLHNNKFVHATATRENGKSGVMISNLKRRYWTKRLMAAGRRRTN
ncbi:MAG: NlpC/P60 family protein [Polaribacter sp.]